MIVLVTPKTLTIQLAEAISTVQPSVVAAYADATDTSLTEAGMEAATNGVTPVTLLGDPGAGTRRIVRSIYLTNLDTVAHTFIVKSNSVTQSRVTLAAGASGSATEIAPLSAGILSSLVVTGSIVAASLMDSGLTAGRITFAGASGLLSDAAGLTWDGSKITASAISTPGQITSTLATGTAPLVIASTTKVANLNVDFLNGTTWAAPGAIGGTTPAAIACTTLTASSLTSGRIPFTGVGGLLGDASSLTYANGEIILNGTANYPGFLVQNDNGSAAQLFVAVGKSDRATTSMGVSEANAVELVCSGASLSALIIGTGTSKDIVIGTNNAERLRFIGAGSIQVTGTTPAAATAGQITMGSGILNVITGLSVGAGARLASETARFAGGTMGTPGATDVLLAAGKVYAGDTSATSIRSAGGVTCVSGYVCDRAASDINQAGAFFNFSDSVGGKGGVWQVGTLTLDLWKYNGSWAKAISVAYSGGVVSITSTTASTSSATGGLTVAGGLGVGGALWVNSAVLIASSTTLNNGAAAAAGTLLNAPAAGNPTKWIPINDNGTTRYIPAW